MTEIQYEIKQSLGELSESKTGWKREVIVNDRMILLKGAQRPQLIVWNCPCTKC